LVHVPTSPGKSHRIPGPVQAVLQQTPSTQKPVPHCDGVAQAPPCGTWVLVGVAVGVALGLLVGVSVCVGELVGVSVCVGELVGVSVGVSVGVPVGVSVGVAVAAGVRDAQLGSVPTPETALG
jgi:hypothetical protein